MNSPAEVLRERRTVCETRLGDLRSLITKIPELSGAPDLCVYVTGSYGRGEASNYSDLDLFFLHKGSQEHNSMSRIDKTLMDAQLITDCRKLGFPEFSADAEYLQIHYIDDMLAALGSREDDYRNYFTARMLLLLESSPIHNECVYADVLGKVVQSYFRDYHDHDKDFRPIFLINDILRFWKTLCLNYEHRRNRPAGNPEERNKSHLRNLKLKFSRMLTCYSMVIPLSMDRRQITPDKVVAHVRDAALQRISKVATSCRQEKLLSQIQEQYAWFLQMTGRPRPEVIRWIGEREQRNVAFGRARKFGSMMYELLHSTADEEALRYLVI